MEKLNTLIKQIKTYNKNALCIIVNDKSFNHPFLLVSTNQIKQKIMLFDGENGLNRFAEISYSKPTTGIVLATFEVDESHQRQGFGKFLFNLATAHADILGCTHLEGTACPTAPIKGVSKHDKEFLDEDTSQKEQEAIVEVYKKLGCSFEEKNSFFEHHWTGGDKINNSNPLIQDIAYQIAETYGFTPPSQME